MKEDLSADFFIYPSKFWSIEWKENDVVEYHGTRYVENDNYDWLAYLSGFRQGLQAVFTQPDTHSLGSPRAKSRFIQGFYDARDDTYE